MTRGEARESPARKTRENDEPGQPGFIAGLWRHD